MSLSLQIVFAHFEKSTDLTVHNNKDRLSCSYFNEIKVQLKEIMEVSEALVTELHFPT